MTFQELILTLHRFWAEQGCVIHQPYDVEMGAGTFHPATFLRSLGPELWRSAYTQACRYPDGTNVLCATVIELAGDAITAQTCLQVWDEN